MNIDLHRTFSPYTDSPEDDDAYWTQYLTNEKKRKTWDDLHQKRVTVVLGEAGIGKTSELELQSKRMAAAGHFSFFLPLNMLVAGTWADALEGELSSFESWLQSDRDGYFFLDAVDEARLATHADFKRAVLATSAAIAPNATRARIIISSRVTDWTVPDVQKTVQVILLRPILQAIAKTQAASAVLAPNAATLGEARVEPASSPIGKDSQADFEELFVVTLDALSEADAHRCALHFGVKNEAAFWAAVEEGNYKFMASRPLDLQWMVKLWNRTGVLGIYAELIEANIVERLREPNDLYLHAKRSVAHAQLREGATELAAAMEFGNVPYVAIRQPSAEEGRLLDAFEVLNNWAPEDVRLLLSTAIFDEASFDRVKFHHRSVREYLAAKWVDDKLAKAVPLHRLVALFVSRQNDELVLIPSRRPVLAWLAAINAPARSWVVSNFPEILLHDGDPESWDRQSAARAFDALISSKGKGFYVRDWLRGEGELLRISRALDPNEVAKVLMNPRAPMHALIIAYRLAKFGKINECAAPIFAIYQDSVRPEWERTTALAILATIGSPSHRKQVLADIESGILSTNELVSEALKVANWFELSPTRLAAIFKATHSEGERGTGPMANTLTRRMLPEADLASATLLLQAVLMSLPKLVTGQRLEWYPPDNEPEHAWLLYAVPYCLQRVLELTQELNEPLLSAVLEAAEQTTLLRNTGFFTKEAALRLRSAIKAIPQLRWKLAVAVSNVVHRQRPADHLVRDDWSLVNFDSDDLDELTCRSHEIEVKASEQALWFEVGVEVALRLKSGHQRAIWLRALQGKEDVARRKTVGQRYANLHGGVRSQQKWSIEERARQEAWAKEHARLKANFIAKKANIEDGSDYESLAELLVISHQHSGWDDNEGLKLDVVAGLLGPEIAKLFVAGLKAYWKKAAPPNPSDFPGGRIPTAALVSFAGATLSLSSGVEIAKLTMQEITFAAQVAVWALPGPPLWFEALYEAWPSDVVSALSFWVLEEVKNKQPGTGVRGAFVLAMRCPTKIRQKLISSTAPLISSGEVKHNDVRMQLTSALFEDGVISELEFDRICGAELNHHHPDISQPQAIEWLQIWAPAHPQVAWDWCKKHLSLDERTRATQLCKVADAVMHPGFPQKIWNADFVPVFHEIYNALRVVANSDVLLADAKELEEGTVANTFYVITNELAHVPGALGRSTLQQLLSEESNPVRASALQDAIHEHSSRGASMNQQWNIERLRALHVAFDSDPVTEAQLYEQVLARLEEVRTSLQEGPFSERRLFPPDTPEKHLQLWLASKFRDTQNCRFSVHREEEVDDDKKTDIQLSYRQSNVCVEIKPADADRGYSANSLVDTLRTQIVSQYLKGNNSSRGILVLVQLDDKRWDIPCKGKKRPFSVLVEYLKEQAEAIKVESPHVNELTVFPISCII